MKQNLYYQIEITARKIRLFGQSILDKHGLDITIEQWLVLKTVNENQGINAISIGEKLLKDKPTISKMVKSLIAKGYIEKKRSYTDNRSYSIHLTDSGVKMIDSLMPIVEEIRLQGLGNLTDEEKTMVEGILAKIINNVGG